MKKIHDLKTVVIDNIAYNYFYTAEKSDHCGNPRYRVFIIDPDGPAVYETILKTYCLSEAVRFYIEYHLIRGEEE